MADDELSFKGHKVDEHANWKKIEQKVNAAFKALAKEDIYTSTEIIGTGGDGEYEVAENLQMAIDDDGKTYVGYAYYNEMDKKEGRAEGQLSINFNSYSEDLESDPKVAKEVGQKVVKAMEAEGLDCYQAQMYNIIIVSLK